MVKTIAKYSEYAEVIRKSRFIARVGPANTMEEAISFIDSVKDSNASHNCWAYRMGTLYRFSDDGEPGGTAGRPILTAIERQGIDNVIVVVTRFFGGIKLGAGGLIRAYGGVAAKCLQQASLMEIKIRYMISLSFGYECLGAVRQVLNHLNLRPDAEDFLSHTVTFQLFVDEDDLEKFREAMGNACRGSAQIKVAHENPFNTTV